MKLFSLLAEFESESVLEFFNRIVRTKVFIDMEMASRVHRIIIPNETSRP